MTRLFSSNSTFCLILVSILTVAHGSNQAKAQSAISMFVTSRDNNSVKEYDGETGEYIGDFIQSGDGSLNDPQEIFFGPDGHAYVTGFRNPNIKKYDGHTGEYLEEFSSGYTLSQPSKMTFHSDSLIYISQWSGNEKVVRFDMNTGAFVDEFTSTGVINGCGHAWDEEGNLYVASWGSDGSNGAVHKFAPDGDFIEIFIPAGRGGLSGPVNVWFKDGDLFVVDWTLGDVLQYDGETGDYIGRFITGMVRTEGFVFDQDGFVYLADWQTDRVNRYDSTGAFVDVFVIGGGLSTPNSVAFGPSTVFTSNEEDPPFLENSFVLRQNYPNPFRGATTISYVMPAPDVATLKVYNLRGEEVTTLVDRLHPAGEYEAKWDGTDESGSPVASGVYFYRLAAGSVVQSQKMVVFR